jgi:GT2 family glycosyltransferase
VELTVHFIVHGDYEHIDGALQSLYATTHTPCHIIITINTGDDPKIETIRRDYPDIEIVVNDQPKGFAENHNAVMRRGETPFVALLNDDLTLQEGALDTLVGYLKDHPRAGLVGPALQNPDGSPQVSAYSDPSLFRTIYKISGFATLTSQQSPIRRWLLKTGILKRLNIESFNTDRKTRSVQVIKGAAMVVRREAYLQAGLMDEVTLAYGEEYGWHLRLRQHRWVVVLVTEAQVTHYGLGQAKLKLQGWLLAEDRKASLAYYLLYRPAWQGFVVRSTIIIVHACYGLLWSPFNRKRAKAHFNTVNMALRLSRSALQ